VCSGIGSHLLESRARATLAIGPACGGRTGAVQALDEVIPDLLQLGHVGDVPRGAQEGMRGFAGLSRVGGIGGELCLEVRDLPAQLLPAEPLVAFDGRHLGALARW
jgi:hypothetical protein